MKPLHPLMFYPNTTSNYTVDVTSGTTTCQSDVAISVNQRDIVSIDSTYCDSIQWDGNWLASTGTYVDTLQNVAGCDSIVILNLLLMLLQQLILVMTPTFVPMQQLT